MDSRTLTRLAAAAVLALVAALWFGRHREPATLTDAQKPLVPGLKEALNDVTTIRFVGAESKPLATLTRKDDGWHIGERGDYAADTTKVREFLLKLADAQLLEAKTAKPELHKKLGVEDPAQKDATGVRVELEGGKGAAKIVIGRFNGQGGDGTFVRQADDAQVWLAKGNLTVERNPADWLNKALTDIPASRIQSVELTYQGKTLRAFKNSSSDANFQVADLPKGRELSSEFAANGFASVLSALKFDDVARRDPAQEPEAATQREIRYVGFDGLQVTAHAWEKDGKDYAVFEAALDETAAKADIERQQARDRADYEAKKAEFDSKAKSQPADVAAAGTAPPPSAADGAKAPAAGDKKAGVEALKAAAKDAPPAEPLAVTDPAKDQALRLERLQKEVAALNQRFSGWAFVMPAYKYANMNRGMDDVLKPLESKKPDAKDGKAAAPAKAPAFALPKPPGGA